MVEGGKVRPKTCPHHEHEHMYGVWLHITETEDVSEDRAGRVATQTLTDPLTNVLISAPRPGHVWTLATVTPLSRNLAPSSPSQALTNLLERDADPTSGSNRAKRRSWSRGCRDS